MSQFDILFNEFRAKPEPWYKKLLRRFLIAVILLAIATVFVAGVIHILEVFNGK